MHPNSIRAGYLDLDGCTVADLLPRLVCSRILFCCPCYYSLNLHFILVASFPLAPNVQRPSLRLGSVQSEAQALWQYAVNAIGKWVWQCAIETVLIC